MMESSASFAETADFGYRIKEVRKLAQRVVANGGTPLSPGERAALLRRLPAGPVYLLGSSTVFARDFAEFVGPRFAVRAVVDDFASEPTIHGAPRIDSACFSREANGGIAICLSFSHQGWLYFRRLAREAGATFVDYMDMVDAIPGFPCHPLLSGLASVTASSIERLLSALPRFADELSWHTFLSILAGRLTYDRTWLEAVSIGAAQMYFGPEFLSLGATETLVDCGAYTGDTIAAFRAAVADRFERIYAFEPDPANFQTLVSAYGNDDRLVLLNCGVGAEPGSQGFVEGDGSFSRTVGRDSKEQSPQETRIALTTLDASVPRATMIKIDVEGYEPGVLAGAAETIRRDKPRLAVAAYHAPRRISLNWWNKYPICIAGIVSICGIMAASSWRRFCMRFELLGSEGSLVFGLLAERLWT